MIAAADDPNIKAVVLVMPLLSGRADAANFVSGSLRTAWEERKARCLESNASPKQYIQVWDQSQEQAGGNRNSTLIHGTVPYDLLMGAKKLSDAAGTPWQNKLSLQSLYSISRCEPQDYIPRISPRPLLHIAANEDPLSGPPEAHEKAFATAGEPKEFVLLENHHIANYFENFENNVQAQLKFLKIWL